MGLGISSVTLMESMDMVFKRGLRCKFTQIPSWMLVDFRVETGLLVESTSWDIACTVADHMPPLAIAALDSEPQPSSCKQRYCSAILPQITAHLL